MTEKRPKNKDLTALYKAKTLAIEDLYVYISNRSKGRLDVTLRIAKKAHKTFLVKLQNNTMGSDIQSLVLGTIAFSCTESIYGPTPPEIKNEKNKTNPFFALPTSELHINSLQNQLLIA